MVTTLCSHDCLLLRVRVMEFAADSLCPVCVFVYCSLCVGEAVLHATNNIPEQPVAPFKECLLPNDDDHVYTISAVGHLVRTIQG